MGLGENEVLKIAEACSKCRTLLSVHLTGNEVYEVYEVHEKLKYVDYPGFKTIDKVGYLKD